MWKPVEEIIAEFRKAEGAGATMCAVVMGYICLDTMAYLSMPAGREQNTRADFIAFVDTYLKAHKDQPYQYRGIDIYAARCAVFHQYGSEAEMHRNDPGIKTFGYNDGGRHSFNPDVSNNLVLIGTASLIDDIESAVGDYAKACLVDTSLRKWLRSDCRVC